MLRRWSEGDSEAANEVLPLVYGELRKLARSYLRRERGDHTLETSGLINEAFMRLTGQRQVTWSNRKHFYGIAAQAMRRILVDYARQRGREKRGGGLEIIAFDEAWQTAVDRPGELLALDDALEQLAEMDPERAQLVELRFFGGLSHREIAELWETSLSSVERKWRLARAFLHNAMKSL